MLVKYKLPLLLGFFITSITLGTLFVYGDSLNALGISLPHINHYN